jgi:iron complex outermembrane recepter protein
MRNLPSVFWFLGFCLASPVYSSLSFAEEPSPEVLPEVVVTSTRLPGDPVDVRTLPAKVTVITADEIQRSGAKTVQEAIQQATGIVMYDAIGNAFQQTIDLRGFNGQPVLGTSVFVDGVRMNEPDFNTVNFDLIPLETVERIEILPGPSAIFGKNALGGVINIITKRGGAKPQATGGTLFGSFHRERYNINTGGPLGKLDYYTNFTRETENGFRDESDARISRFTGKLGYRPTEGSDLAVSYNYVKSRLLQAGSLPLSQAAIDPKRNFTPGDFFDSETNFVRVTGRQALPLGFSLNANGFYRQLGQELFTASQPFLVGGMITRGATLTHTESRGGVLQLTHDAAPFGHRNDLILGGEFTRNDVGSRLHSVSDFGTFTNRRDTDEDNWGIYAQDTVQIGSQLLISAGVRYDQDTIETDFEDSFTAPARSKKIFSRTTPRAGVTYLMTDRVSLYFNYSEGFRVPTIDELFTSSGPFGSSNPDLNPVRSRNYELGVRSKADKWWEGHVALFQADVRDEIFFSCILCDFSPGDGQNRNVDKTRRRGIEGTFKAKYGQLLEGIMNYSYTEAEFRSPFRFSTVRVIEVGDSFPLVPKHRLSVTGNFYPSQGWTVSLAGLYVSTQFHQNDEENTRPRLPGYFVLNGRISYERPVPGGRLIGFFMVNNILDQQYFTSGIIATNTLTGGGAQERFVVPAPGIAFYGGLSYRFEAF